MNIQPVIRFPTSWEANLLASFSLLMLIVSSGLLAVFFQLPVVIILGQLLFIAPTLLWVGIRRFPLQATFRLYSVPVSTILWSVLIGFTCWPVVAGMVALLEKPLLLLGPYPPTPYPTNWVESAAYGVAYIVLAPLTEEPIYRGFILQAWLRRGVGVGIGLSGLLFGLLHSQIAPLIPLTLFGIVLALLAYRSQSVLSSIFAHASYNTAATLFVIIPSLQATGNNVFMILGIIALPILLVLIWMFLLRHPAFPTGTPPQEEPRRWKTVITLLIVLGLYSIMAILEIVMRRYPNLMDLKGV